MTVRRLVWTSFNRHVHALDAETGEVVWSQSFSKGGPSSALVVHRGSVFVASHGYVYAFDAYSGQRLWENLLEGRGVGVMHLVVSPLIPTSELDPTHSMSRCIWVSLMGYVHALDRETGVVKWSSRFGTTHKARSPRMLAYMLVRGDCLLVGQDGNVHCLDALSGALRWGNPMRGHGFGPTQLTHGSETHTTQAVVAFATTSGG